MLKMRMDLALAASVGCVFGFLPIGGHHAIHASSAKMGWLCDAEADGVRISGCCAR